MAYKGTPLFMPDEGLLEIMQIARDSGVMVMVHAENGDAMAKLQEQALARGDVDPIWHAHTRPEAVEAEATGRAIRLAEIADAALGVVHVTCAGAADEIRRAHDARPGRARRDVPPVPGDDDRRPEQARVRGREVRLLARRCATPPTTTSSGARLATGELVLVGLGPLRVRLRRPEGARPGRLHEDPQRHARGRGARADPLDPRRAQRAHQPRDVRRRARRPTRRGCTGCCRARASSPPAPTRTSWCGTPSCRSPSPTPTATTRTTTRPTRVRSWSARPERVYVRGTLAYLDGDVVAEPGSGEFLPRSLGDSRGARSPRDRGARPAAGGPVAARPGGADRRRRRRAAGGLERHAGIRARDWLRERLAEIPGVEVHTDPAGNIWAALPGESERSVVAGRPHRLGARTAAGSTAR